MVSYILILDQLVVDTGSSNIWVGANKSYIKTKTSIKTSDSFVSIVSRDGFLRQLKLKLMAQNITYGSAQVNGKLPCKSLLRYVHILSQVPSTSMK